jgi:hypothetical protein
VLPHEVQLSKTRVPVWPDRCIVCERESPGHRVPFNTYKITALSTILMSFGDRERLTIPACVPCGRRLVWGARARMVLAFVLCGAAFYALKGVFGLPAGIWRTPAMIGYALVGIVPSVVLSFVMPPAFDVTSFEKSIDYEFKSKAYAAAFAALNDSCVK